MAKGTLNRVSLIGSLGSDVELKHTPQGVAVASFSMATNEGYKDQSGQWQDKTEWHRIVLWRGMAETASKFLKKGSKIYLEGKLQTRNWDKDGQKHYTTEIVGSSMEFLGGRMDGQGGNSQQQGQQSQQVNYQNNQQQPVYDIPDTDFDSSELPF